MPTTAADISVVLSGGGTNTNPDVSLGGDPSATLVVDETLNNLFDNVSVTETDTGSIDFRCLYFFNDGDSTVYEVELWIDTDFEAGADVSLGLDDRNERQRITIQGGPPTGGSMNLSYEGAGLTSSYNADLTVWADALAASLNSLISMGQPLLQDVEVSASESGGTVIFDIVFAGLDGSRNHESIVLTANNLTPSGLTVTITTVQTGSPVNTIAPEIPNEVTPPGGVTFSIPTQSSPLTLPRLAAGEGFPFWVRRDVAAGTAAKADDGFVLGYRMLANEPE